MKIVQQYKKYTDRQRSQCFIFLQGKSDFFYSFISNDIASYQGQPIMSTYQAAAYLACYYFSMLVQFPLLLHRQYYFHLQTVAIDIPEFFNVSRLTKSQPSFSCSRTPFKKNTLRHTEIQRSQRFIFLQGKSDFLYSFISNIIIPYKGQRQCIHTKMQRIQRAILLQCKSNFLYSFIPKTIVFCKQTVSSKIRTEVQHSQCLILLQSQANFFRSFSAKKTESYQQRNNAKHTQIQYKSQRTSSYEFQEVDYVN
eukprot:TRINITY_DN2782_c0_g1_i3.p1 TRINITY_DN2782_c0_g1~~TRINITY_DN2782_c0_g1_i3.p1  ORF type:complete len:290 (+),score=-39.29 TRINITY_DN2782_c0_g1_i3:112-870(+)